MKIDEMQMVILIISTLDIKVFRSKDYTDGKLYQESYILTKLTYI